MNHKKPKRGITLIELLVVIGIMMMLAAVVLPQLNLGGRSRKVRDASETISTYLSAARNRAIRTGRPCGVLFERVDGRPNASVQMVQVHEPAPYAGNMMDSRATVLDAHSGHAIIRLDTYAVLLDLIRPGDLIQLDFKGPWYTIGDDLIDNDIGAPEPDGKLDGLYDGDGDGSPDGVDITIHAPFGCAIPHYPGGTKVPFLIRRQPVTASSQLVRSLAPPQQLPQGIAVDMTASGMGSHFFSTLPNSTVTIMFDPNGSVYAIYGLDTNIDGSADVVKPVKPIYLLVGEEMQVPKIPGETVKWFIPDANLKDADKDEIPNWQSADSRWVVISPSTGTVTVGENAGNCNGWADDGLLPNGDAVSLPCEVQIEAIPDARSTAGQGLGGGENR